VSKVKLALDLLEKRMQGIRGNKVVVLHDRLAIGPSAHMVSVQHLYTKTQKEILCLIPPVYMANK